MKGLKINDKRIAHLKNLGRDLDGAVIKLERWIEKARMPNIEKAEIIHSHTYRDGGIPHSSLCYVAGVCGEIYTKNDGDLGKGTYKIVYFTERTLESNSNWVPEMAGIDSFQLRDIIDYIPLKGEND